MSGREGPAGVEPEVAEVAEVPVGPGVAVRPLRGLDHDGAGAPVHRDQLAAAAVGGQAPTLGVERPPVAAEADVARDGARQPPRRGEVVRRSGRVCGPRRVVEAAARRPRCRWPPGARGGPSRGRWRPGRRPPARPRDRRPRRRRRRSSRGRPTAASGPRRRCDRWRARGPSRAPGSRRCSRTTACPGRPRVGPGRAGHASHLPRRSSRAAPRRASPGRGGPRPSRPRSSWSARRARGCRRTRCRASSGTCVQTSSSSAQRARRDGTAHQVGERRLRHRRSEEAGPRSRARGRTTRGRRRPGRATSSDVVQVSSTHSSRVHVVPAPATSRPRPHALERRSGQRDGARRRHDDVAPAGVLLRVGEPQAGEQGARGRGRHQALSRSGGCCSAACGCTPHAGCP